MEETVIFNNEGSLNKYSSYLFNVRTNSSNEFFCLMMTRHHKNNRLNFKNIMTAGLEMLFHEEKQTFGMYFQKKSIKTDVIQQKPSCRAAVI